MSRPSRRTGRRFVRPMLAAGIGLTALPAPAAAEEPVSAVEKRAMEELRVLDRRRQRSEPAAAASVRPAVPIRQATPAPSTTPAPRPTPVRSAISETPHAVAPPAHAVEKNVDPAAAPPTTMAPPVEHVAARPTTPVPSVERPAPAPSVVVPPAPGPVAAKPAPPAPRIEPVPERSPFETAGKAAEKAAEPDSRPGPRVESAAATPEKPPSWFERLAKPFRRSSRTATASRSPERPAADEMVVVGEPDPATPPRSVDPPASKVTKPTTAPSVAAVDTAWADLERADSPKSPPGDPFEELRTAANPIADAPATGLFADAALASSNPFAETAAPAESAPAIPEPRLMPSDEQTRPLFAGPSDDDGPPPGYSAEVWERLGKPCDVGANGVCLVTLRNELTLVEGAAEFSSTFDGREYRFASAAAKATFDASPAKFVPAAAGRDAVLLASGRTADGTLRHATYYRSRLYVFESVETFRQFESDPEKFAGTAR